MRDAPQAAVTRGGKRRVRGRGRTAPKRAAPGRGPQGASMSEREVLERIAAALGDAALDDARWARASALIDEACGAKGNILTYGSGTSSDDVRLLHARLLYRGEPREAIAREYFSDYYPRDERVPRLRALPEGRVVHTREVYTEAERKTSAAYNVMLPRGEFRNSLNVRLDGAHGMRINWGIADPVGAREWSNAQVETIGRIAAHLRHYVGVRQALAEARALGASLTGLLEVRGAGVVQLDARGRIVAANDAARALLRDGDGLCDQGGMLRAWAPADDAALQRAVAGALGRVAGAPVAGGTTALLRPSLRPRLVVHVTPVGSAQADFRPWRIAALVLVVDPARRARVEPALVAQALDLTPAESQVAVMLAEGRSVGEIAAATGRKASTIRWHLLSIFNKTSLPGQVELVRVVSSLAGIPWSPPEG